MLLPDNVYNPSKDFARHEMANYGIAHRVYDAMDVPSLAAQLTPEVKLVWLEAPGSVTLEFPDLPALIRSVREKGAAGGDRAGQHLGGCRPGLQPVCAEDANGDSCNVDLTIHALTKYPSGGGDVLDGLHRLP